MVNDDKRLIEDYLPIVDISAEASREKSVRKGHISTLHLWWARRPLVACRAAVYGALVPASQFVPGNGTDAQKKSLGRANAAKFIKALCQYPGSPHAIKEAQEHILKAHAERLTNELRSSRREEAQISPLPARSSRGEGQGEGQSEKRASSPRPSPPSDGGEGVSAPGWVTEFNWPADKTTVTVEDILAGRAPRPRVLDMFAGGGAIPLEALRLGCEAYALDLNSVAHIIQLCTLVYPQKFGKPDPNARGMTGPKNDKGEATWGGLAEEVRYWGNWVLAKVRAEIGDLYPLIPDPECLESRLQAAAATKAQSASGPPSTQPAKAGTPNDPFADPQSVMGFAADPQQRLKAKAGYLTPVAYLWTRTVQCKNPACVATVPLVKQTWLCKKEGRNVALKMIPSKGQKRARFEVVVARSASALGFDPEAFSKAGNATCPFCGTVADNDYVKVEGSAGRMLTQMMAVVCIKPVGQGKTYLSADHCPFSCPKETELDKALVEICRTNELTRPAEPMPKPGTLGFRVQPYGVQTCGDLFTRRQNVCLLAFTGATAAALRHMEDENVPRDMAAAVAEPTRYGGSKERARLAYEEMMAKAFGEAHRVLTDGGTLVVVYAHKTTLGWSTLVDALRKSGFTITEAWPLASETSGRLRAHNSAALASSIFLTARKRSGTKIANYDEQVRPELESIVRERVETLWDMGISGADLVIACVGAGLRAFTRFARVEYANGEEVPAERFLAEVETVVLETILDRLSKEVTANKRESTRMKGEKESDSGISVHSRPFAVQSLSGLDAPSRFYILWRYTYGAAELEAGEAIIFANGTHVELDGQHGLTGGSGALVEKKKSKYRLRDFTERGENEALGLPMANGQSAPLVDTLHRTLWLMEKRPTELSNFLRDAQPNREQLRLVAQALAGPALKGGELGDLSPTAELSALGKLTANWQSVIEAAALTTGEKEERRTGQKQLI